MSSAIRATPGTVRAMAKTIRPSKARPALPERSRARGRRLRRHRRARLARDRLARALALGRDRGQADELRRHRVGRRAADRLHPRPRRQLAELAREPPATSPRSAAASRWTCPASATRRCRARRSRSRATRARSTRSASSSTSGECIVVGNSMGGFVAAEIGIRHPERVERACLVAAAGISITNLRRRPLLTARAHLRRARRRVRGAEPLHGRAAAPALVLHELRLPPPVADRARPDVRAVRGAGKPGFSTRSTRSRATTSATGCPRSRRPR